MVLNTRKLAAFLSPLSFMARSSTHAARHQNEKNTRGKTIDAHRRLSGALALSWGRWLLTSAFDGLVIGSPRRNGARCRRLHAIRAYASRCCADRTEFSALSIVVRIAIFASFEPRSQREIAVSYSAFNGVHPGYRIFAGLSGQWDCT